MFKNWRKQQAVAAVWCIFQALLDAYTHPRPVNDNFARAWLPLLPCTKFSTGYEKLSQNGCCLREFHLIAEWQVHKQQLLFHHHHRHRFHRRLFSFTLTSLAGSLHFFVWKSSSFQQTKNLKCCCWSYVRYITLLRYGKVKRKSTCYVVHGNVFYLGHQNIYSDLDSNSSNAEASNTQNRSRNLFRPVCLWQSRFNKTSFLFTISAVYMENKCSICKLLCFYMFPFSDHVGDGDDITSTNSNEQCTG